MQWHQIQASGVADCSLCLIVVPASAIGVEMIYIQIHIRDYEAMPALSMAGLTCAFLAPRPLFPLLAGSCVFGPPLLISVMSFNLSAVDVSR